MEQQTSSEYIEALEDEISAEPFTEKLRVPLEQMLQTRSMQLAFKFVIVEGINLAGQIATTDMSEPKGVSEAIKIQGKIEGLQRALDIIFECSLKEDEPEEGEQDGKGN